MPSHCYRMRAFDRDLIRGGHYGQRSCEPHLKAEHMAAPTNAVKREESSCQLGAVHTWHKADIGDGRFDVRFSNRPSGVKHFQAIHHCSVDVAHGLALLFGIGTKALPSWDPRTRWNNLSVGLAVRQAAGPSGHANSPHPSSREGHLSTAGWSSSVLLSDLIFHGFMLRLVLGSSGTRCRPPRCGAGSRPAGGPAPRSPFSSRDAWRSASPRP